MTGDVLVRAAEDDDRIAVLRLLDGAMLAVDHGRIADRIDQGHALVAETDGRVVGAILFTPRESGAHVEAVAVQRERRNRGIGSALVESVLDRQGRVTADFQDDVEPFWRSLGFAVERREGRLWGEK